MFAADADPAPVEGNIQSWGNPRTNLAERGHEWQDRAAVMSRRWFPGVLFLFAACPGFVEPSRDAAGRDAAPSHDRHRADDPRSAATDTTSGRDHSATVDGGVDTRRAGRGSPTMDSISPVDGSQPTGSFGSACTNLGGTCADGSTYCIGEPFDTRGYCSKLCLNAKAQCSGTPQGTIATCVMQASDPGGGPVLLCGFLCEHGGKSYPCPAWPNGSICDAEHLCHPK